MKKITIILFLLISFINLSSYAGTVDGKTCETAYSQYTNATSIYNFNKNQEKLYIVFEATAEDIYFGFNETNLSVLSEIHKVELFTFYECEESSLIASRTENDENSIRSFLATELEIEGQYLMVISRDATSSLPKTYFQLQGLHYIISPCPSNFGQECWNEVENGDFTYTSVSSPDHDSAFNYLEVCEWSAGLATPQLKYKDNMGNHLADPYAELHFERYYTAGNPLLTFQLSEGTKLNYSVTIGDQISITQDLRVKHSNRKPQDFRITLIKQSTINTFGNSFNVEDILGLPNNLKQDVVIAQANDLTTSWNTFQECITATGDFDRIIFYPLAVQNTTTLHTQVHQDKVKIQAMEVDAGADETANCDQTVTIGPTCLIPNATYSWSPTNGLSDPNIPNPIVYNNDNETYTLTVSYPCGNGQFYTFTDVVTVFQPTYDIIVPDGEDMSYLRTNYASMFSTQNTNRMFYKTIKVEGTFTIDEGVTFSGCDFFMSEDGRINIEELVIFEGFQSSFQTCDPTIFWDGIYINGTGQTNHTAMNFTSLQGTFSNAENGIVVSNGAGLNLQDVTFDRNNKCVTIKNYDSHYVGFWDDIIIYNNTFTCSSPLINSSGNEYYPITAFEIDNFRRTSAANGWGMIFAPNTFYGKAGRMYIKNSNIDIDRLRFYDYNNQYTLQGEPNVQEQALLIEGELNGSNVSDLELLNCQFINTKNGIKVNGKVIFDLLNSEANEDASGNGYGGIAGSNFLTIIDNEQAVNIDNNTINNVQTGIFAFTTTDLTISNNDFDLETQVGTDFTFKTNHNSTAISINNVGYTGSNAIAVDVSDNLIIHAKRGIYAQFTDAVISNNTILDLNDIETQPTNCFPNPTCPPSPAYGIRAINSINSYTIIENKVENDLSHYTSPYPSENTDVMGIDVENTMSAYSTSSAVTCNKVKGTGIGMRFGGTNDPLTRIEYNSMQDHKYGFVLANNGFVGNVGSNGTTSDNEWNGTYIGSHTLSDNSNGSACTIYTRSGGTTSNGGVYDPLINVIAHVTNNGIGINKDNSGNFPNSPLCTIRTRLHSDNAAAHNLSEHDKANAFKLRKDLLNGAMPFMVNKIESAAALNQQLLFHKSLNNIANENYTELTQFTDSMKNTMIGEILEQNDIKVLQQELTMSDLLMKDIKEFNDKLFKGESLSKTEYKMLEEIASFCPYEDGIAVYYARAIIEKQSKRLIVNNCELTKGENFKELSISANTVAKDWNEANGKLYPNPTSGQITLDYIVEEGNNLTLTIFDLMGKKHRSLKLTEGMIHQFNLEEMHTGIYFYRLNNDNEVLKSGKLIIE